MEFHHAPKLWHGWREFLREYVIVVVGVLTAAAVGLMVDWLHNRNEIREAREALHAELVKNAAILRDGVLEDQCLLARVNLGAKYGLPVKPPAPVLNLPNGDYPQAIVWETVRSGAVTRMPLKERLGYANFYAHVSNQQSAVQAKGSLMRSLAGLVFGTWPQTPAEARLTRQEFVRSQVILDGKVQYGRDMLTELKSLGVRPPPLSDASRAVLEAECSAAGTPLGASA